MDSCTACAECDDSIFSIFSGSFGILNGVLALLAALFVQFRLVRQAVGEIERLQLETEVRFEMMRARIDSVKREWQTTTPTLLKCLENLINQ